MSDCLNANYIPFNSSDYGRKLSENRWEPVWFEGKALPDSDVLHSTNTDPDTEDSSGAEDLSDSDEEESDESDYVESNDSESETD